MAHIPYGYRIENGRAVVDEEQAAQVRKVYEEYLNGKALMAAAKEAGLAMYHGSVGRILRNRHYLGDEFYPPIIDQLTFEKAEEKRLEKANALGRIRELEKDSKPECATEFHMPKIMKKYDDPFKQAEYVYSLIESEVRDNDSN